MSQLQSFHQFRVERPSKHTARERLAQDGLVVACDEKIDGRLVLAGLKHQTGLADVHAASKLPILQDLQRFHGAEDKAYLCTEIQGCSRRSTDRMVVSGTGDGGSSPPGSTRIVLSSNW